MSPSPELPQPEDIKHERDFLADFDDVARELAGPEKLSTEQVQELFEKNKGQSDRLSLLTDEEHERYQKETAGLVVEPTPEEVAPEPELQIPPPEPRTYHRQGGLKSEVRDVRFAEEPVVSAPHEVAPYPAVGEKTFWKKLSEFGAKYKEDREYRRQMNNAGRKITGQVGYRTLATIFGVKTLTDIGLWAFKGKGDIADWWKDREKVKKERSELVESLDNFFDSYKANDNYDQFHTRVMGLEQKIKESKYLTDEDRKEYRSQLARTIWQYRKQDQELDYLRDRRIAKQTELYLQAKVTGFRLVGDALNTTFTFAGMPVLRGVGYSLGAMAERAQKADIKYLREQEMKVDTPGSRADQERRNRWKFILKDLIVNATTETAQALWFKGKTTASKHRGRDFVEALGSVSRGVGLTGVIISELNTDEASEEISKALDVMEKSAAENGVVLGVGGQTPTGVEKVFSQDTQPELFTTDLHQSQPAEETGPIIPPSETPLPVEKTPIHWTPENITVGKGGSYWSTFMKQYEANPEYFGYDPDSGLSVEQYGNKFAAENFKDLGLVDTQGNEVVGDIRIKSPDAQIKWFMKDGHLDMTQEQPGGPKIETYVHEYKPGLQTEVKGPGVTVGAESTDPSTWDKEGGWTEVQRGALGHEHVQHFKEITAADLPKDFKPNADLHLEVLDADGDGGAETYNIVDDNYVSVMEISRDNAEKAVDFKARAIDQYHVATVEANELGRTVAVVKDLSSGDRLRLTNGLDLKFADGLVTAESKSLVTEVINKLGDQAPHYLQDRDLGVYIKDHLADIKPDLVSKLYDQGADLHKAGIKSLDYDVVEKIMRNRAWHLKGGVLQGNLKSPFTNENIAVPFKGGALNQEIFEQATKQAIDHHNSFTRAFNNLVGAYESTGLGTSHLNSGTVSKIMEMPANASLVDWQEKFGGTFKDATVAKLYKDLDSQLGGKFSSGGLSGTVGENVEKALKARAVATDWQGELTRFEKLNSQAEMAKELGRLEKLKQLSK